jgi:hypothetical protein
MLVTLNTIFNYTITFNVNTGITYINEEIIEV